MVDPAEAIIPLLRLLGDNTVHAAGELETDDSSSFAI